MKTIEVLDVSYGTFWPTDQNLENVRKLFEPTTVLGFTGVFNNVGGEKYYVKEPIYWDGNIGFHLYNNPKRDLLP